MKDNLQYIANPTIDRIFNMQKRLAEEFENAHSEKWKILKEEFACDDVLDRQERAEKNLPDPLASRKIQKSGSNSIRRKIPKKSLQVLQDWLLKNVDDPYPSKETKLQLAAASGLTFKQVLIALLRCSS